MHTRFKPMLRSPTCPISDIVSDSNLPRLFAVLQDLMPVVDFNFLQVLAGRGDKNYPFGFGTCHLLQRHNCKKLLRPLELKSSWNFTGKLKLSCNSILVGSLGFRIQQLPCSVSLRCMLGEVVWRFEQRTFYLGSLRVKTHFGMPRGTENEFGPQSTELGCSSFKFQTLPLCMHTTGKKLLKFDIVCKPTNKKSYRTNSQQKAPLS